MSILSTVKLTRTEFTTLRNYSCSVPTGYIEGKQWRRAKKYHDQDISDESKWVVGTYKTVDCSKTIEWSSVEIISQNEELIRNRLYSGT